MKPENNQMARLSFKHVRTPRNANGEPKYSVVFLMPKADAKTCARLAAAIENAYQNR